MAGGGRQHRRELAPAVGWVDPVVEVHAVDPDRAPRDLDGGAERDPARRVEDHVPARQLDELEVGERPARQDGDPVAAAAAQPVAGRVRVAHAQSPGDLAGAAQALAVVALDLLQEDEVGPAQPRAAQRARDALRRLHVDVVGHHQQLTVVARGGRPVPVAHGGVGRIRPVEGGAAGQRQQAQRAPHLATIASRRRRQAGNLRLESAGPAW
ncbi:MAG TPA: hypothetical protein VFU21_09015 [Kofleriaceae bacterium]|nr:hypothetical protein [Kofleriaceae bacterium]